MIKLAKAKNFNNTTTEILDKVETNKSIIENAETTPDEDMVDTNNVEATNDVESASVDNIDIKSAEVMDKLDAICNQEGVDDATIFEQMLKEVQNAEKIEVPKPKKVEKKIEKPRYVADDRVLSADEYHSIWIQMTIKFTEDEPILAMCCSKAEEFSVENDVLNIGFNYETSMLLLENESNRNIILDELFKNRRIIPTRFYQLDEPLDQVQENVNRIKSLFDKDILKITKK